MKNKLIFPIILFIILQLIFISNFWNNLENKAKDTFFSIRGKREISNKIVILEIGDETFSVLNERWPFPRSYHARLIENLEKAGAKVIIFDVEFTEHTDKINDELLAETCRKYDNIIFAGKLVVTEFNSSTREQFLLPTKTLMDANVQWGTVNIAAENDGFVRKYELFQKRNETIKTSLGVASLQNIYPQKNIKNTDKTFNFGNTLIPKIDAKSCWINYYGPARTFKMLDYSIILDDSTFSTFIEQELNSDFNEFYLHQNEIKDKIVLVGLTSEEMHDVHFMPFSAYSHKQMAGVEIHANFIEMVLNDDFLYEFSHIFYLLIFFVLSIILFILNVNIRLISASFITAILLIFYLMFSYNIFLRNSILIPILEIPFLLLSSYIMGLAFQYVKTSQEKQFIKNAFNHYIAPDLVNELIANPSKLVYGGEQKEISVIFSDIVSFTSYAESHTPKETVDILREYLSEMVKIIKQNKGTIDKFMGDEIIALFGAPLEMDDHAFWACKAALEMQEKLSFLQKKWQRERKDIFEIGIGINSGIMTVGNLGSDQIFDFTAIGDNMNIGARLENLTRTYPTKHNIIISEMTVNSTKNKIVVKFIEEVNVKGKLSKIKILIPLIPILISTF